ncbi:hypothetical protein L873DRAFT_1822761 [Choiromyces venosus 120613-1]|uniref:Uncharacterized protein n=1 Tax=Choiromyces venosus 120613-1 TaxID=1336337 RepID=A0A3N4IXI8_9PEZI|nr:hypothetical protein L873DRAFT_1822761 [Choiromyces venosus 120613-1]
MNQMPTAVGLLCPISFSDHQSIPDKLRTRCGLGGTAGSAVFCPSIHKLLGFSLVMDVMRK